MASLGSKALLRLLLMMLLRGCVGQSDRPHIVLVLVDDLGWADVGWRDPLMHTPVMDRLAREGVVLTQAYMQPSCTPSRAALLTGLYPFRMGLQHSVFNAARAQYLPANLTLLPQYLQEAGYRTHMVGKWHLGFCHWSLTPTRRGFHTFYGFYNGVEDYYTHIGKKDGYDFRDNEDVDWSARGTYSTHLFSARAERIIRNHNSSQPMFLYLPYQAVHGPFVVPQSYIDNHCSNVSERARSVHCGMVAALDESLGNVTRALQESGLADNTLLVLLSDNGGPTNKGSSNWPLRGAKLTLWEGGTRVTALVHSQSPHLLPGRGSSYNGLVHAVDWLPSLLSAARHPRIPSNLDGLDLWGHIRQARISSPRREMVYNINNVKNHAAIRVGKWKLIEGKAGKPNGWAYPPTPAQARSVPRGRQPTLQLFDLLRDPYETRNLASSRPRLVQRLTRKLQIYRAGMTPWVESPVVRASHPRFHNNTWSPGFCTPPTVTTSPSPTTPAEGWFWK